MTSGVQYRDADYDIDESIDRTASCPDGLQEEYCFVPHFSPKMRRTSSADDIARFVRYYELVRTNRRGFFTWGQYLKILVDDLRSFDTTLIMTKVMMLREVATPVSSEMSNYATASEFESTKRSALESNKKKKRFFVKKEVAGDGESICSFDSISSNTSLTPQTNLLKVMMLREVATPVSSEMSNYATASEFESTKRSALESNKKKKRFFVKKEVAGDGESICSFDSISSNTSLTPQTNLLKVMMLREVATPVSSEMSNYATASEFESTKRSALESNKKKKRFFVKKEVAGDGESICSFDSISSNTSLTPQTNLLKKMCTEIRSLARKTCTTVEKISAKSKYCSACGDIIGSVKVHKKCSQTFGDVVDSPKPLTPSMAKGSNVLRIQSMMFDSPARTPVGGGESLHSEMTFAPHAACRTKPFIKKSPDGKKKC